MNIAFILNFFVIYMCSADVKRITRVYSARPPFDFQKPIPGVRVARPILGAEFPPAGRTYQSAPRTGTVQRIRQKMVKTSLFCISCPAVIFR